MSGKYGAKRVDYRCYDGIIRTFDSKAELQRWIDLELLQAGGEISDLQRAPSYELIPKFTHQGMKYQAVSYQPDFTYLENGIRIVEEFKSEGTVKAEAYVLRKKLFLSQLHETVYFRETIG